MEEDCTPTVCARSIHALVMICMVHDINVCVISVQGPDSLLMIIRALIRDVPCRQLSVSDAHGLIIVYTLSSFLAVDSKIDSKYLVVFRNLTWKWSRRRICNKLPHPVFLLPYVSIANEARRLYHIC